MKCELLNLNVGSLNKYANTIDYMETTILKSLVEGSKQISKGFTCQALVCAATSPQSLSEFFRVVASASRYEKRNCLFVAYRFAETEGFEESEEVAASQKLLHLLQRLGVENIIVGVVLWADVAVQSLGAEMYRSVLDCARSLLESIHSEVLLLRKSAVTQEKQSFIELPPINPEKWQTPHEHRRRLNMSVEGPYTAEPAHRIQDSDYEASVTTLRNTARQVTVSVVNALQKYRELQEVATLLELLMTMLAAVAKECSEPADLLAGKTLKMAMISFRPLVLPARRLALAHSLQRRLDSARVHPAIASEVSLLSNWTKTALRLCAQPTVQPLRPHDDDPENEYQFASSMTVREGRFGTPTQFVFDNNRTKQLAMVMKHSTRKRKKEGESKSGLAALTDIILQGKQAEEAWGQQVQVNVMKGLDLDPKFEAKLLEARKQQMKQEERIGRLIHLHFEDLRIKPEALHGIPDADIYRMIDTAEYSDLPTGLLMTFATKMKERRKRRDRRHTVKPV